ncbi:MULTISPECIES: hypothetical protein [Streptomyces]|uniref:hypothetical protein n=1 Tax=Streptomyces TaxID=1883 RepID=UPI0015CF0599|nr:MULTISPECIES: hypothetical protein [unclassified Streptomyces]
MPLTIQLLLAIALLVLVAGASLALSFAFSRPRASRERIRALSGLLAVLGSNAAIVLVAIWGANRLDTSEGAIGVLTAAFTAVSTMTTAYLGIKAVSNTAKKLTSEQQDEDSNPEGVDGTAMIREQTVSANALKEAATATADAANAAVNAANAARRACEEAKEMAATGAVKRHRTEKGPRRAKQFGRSWRSRTR